MITGNNNPIRNMVSDELFQSLLAHNLLNLRVLRDIEIQHRYAELRKEGLTAIEAIDKIQSEYGYLQPDTVRKIVYNSKIKDLS